MSLSQKKPSNRAVYHVLGAGYALRKFKIADIVNYTGLRPDVVSDALTGNDLFLQEGGQYSLSPEKEEDVMQKLISLWDTLLEESLQIEEYGEDQQAKLRQPLQTERLDKAEDLVATAFVMAATDKSGARTLQDIARKFYLGAARAEVENSLHSGRLTKEDGVALTARLQKLKQVIGPGP